MTEPWTTEWKKAKLIELYSNWSSCHRCPLHKTRNNVVFGSGYANADYLFIGEAPGKEEDEHGDPFIGESGKLLRALTERARINWSACFLTNTLACKTPKNRDPSKTEKAACLPRWQEQIYQVDPLLIIAVGKVAMKTVVGGGGGGTDAITKEHGRIMRAKIPARLSQVSPVAGWKKKFIHYPVMPILHPAYILREDRWDKKTKQWETGGLAHQTFDDLKRARAIVELMKRQYEAVERQVLKRREA